ncbi:MAG: phosphoenolpyruvate carboxykinase [Rickettsiella sp.]|nr:phosphoenolpyruvate carboxykinase [Rickettsiella sp.]
MSSALCSTLSASKLFVDISTEKLIEASIERKEGVIAANGALSVTTGKRTGRSPKDKFIVKEANTEKNIDWGLINQSIEEEHFQALWKRAESYAKEIDLFISNLQVGADSNYYLPVEVITEYAWHNLFARQLFIRPKNFYGVSHKPKWTILSLPGLKTNPQRDNVHSDATLIIHLTERKVLLCGHRYAGEIKKAMFTVLNYLLPAQDVLPMHCSANVGKQGDVALFFGLSGTGKTTLSADPERYLIGDDEHGWSENSIFNFEGGCYAKCIDLSKEREPMIWNAIRHGAVMENVVLDPKTLEPNYKDASLTQNTRVAYPLDFITLRIPENRVARLPNAVIFLSCDLYGVLPPVACLSHEQAAYYFLSGYTALVGSTEVGQIEPIKTTFSTCFGAPFFPRSANVYAELLIKRLKNSDASVYLVNTGWTGGSYGQGQRFSIPITRAIIHAILNNSLKSGEFTTFPGFNFAIPKQLDGIDSRLLNPSQVWDNPIAYNKQARELIGKFIDNFKKFEVSKEICEAGPTLDLD